MGRESGCLVGGLFDEGQRTNTQPRLYSQPGFDYLNTSARPGVQYIRETLDRWFSHYPEPHRHELRSRFRSETNEQHVAAFFELTLHELMRAFRTRVEVHPRVEGTDTRPDFLYESSLGEGAYLEAVLATDQSRAEAAAEARKNRVYDTLNRLSSPDYCIGMDLHGDPASDPPGRQMRGFLSRQLREMSRPEIEVLATRGGLSAMPRWRFEHDGWCVDFYPIPKPPSLRDKAGVRPIGLQFEGFSADATRGAIRNAVAAKASRYGSLDKPFVIAVNVLSLHTDESDVLDALYGDEQFVMGDGPSAGKKTGLKSARSGAWIGPAGPQNTRVSGVLIVPQLFPSTLIRAKACLFHNPWAARPYGGALGRLGSCAVEADGRAHFTPGESMASVLGLPGEWPADYEPLR